MSDRSDKITFAEMRASVVRGLLVYCCDYPCSQSLAISGDPWPEISGFPISNLNSSLLGLWPRRRATRLQLERPETQRRHGLPLTPGTFALCVGLVSTHGQSTDLYGGCDPDQGK
jgi:hypothetical protein